MTTLRRDGMPDRRFAHPNGMRVQGTKVDYFSPRPVCAICGHFDRIHRAPPPHVYHGAKHLWVNTSSAERESVRVVA